MSRAPGKRVSAVPRRGTAKRRGGLLVIVVLLLGVVATNLLSILVVRTSAPESPFPADLDAGPIYVEASVNQTLRPVAGQIELIWSPSRSLTWPGAQGVLTEVLLAPSDEINNGQLIARVNGLGTIALTTPTPFYRDLKSGDRGPDVDQLVVVLRELGLLDAAEQPDRFTSSVSSAVRSLNYLRGVDSKVFSYQYALWLPGAIVSIGQVKLEVGGPAPVAGFGAILLPDTLASATARQISNDGSSSPLERTPLERIVVADGERHRIDSSGALLDAHPLEVGRNPTVDKIDGVRVELATAEDVTEVAASSIVTDREFTCVIVEDGRPLRVTVVGGGSGNVQVQESIRNPILLNPYDTGRTACGP